MNDVHEERGYPARQYNLDKEPKAYPKGKKQKPKFKSNWTILRCICGTDVATKGSRAKCPKCGKTVGV